jgi:uncharacterized membrane protein
MVPVIDRVLPTRADPVARAASTPVGGPWGRHGIVGRQWFWTPVRVLLAMALLTLALGWAQKSPCQTGNWALSKPVSDGKGHTQYILGREYVWMCYSDVIPLYGSEGLDQNKIPYRDHAVEYPVLTGGFMYVAAELARGYQSLAADASSVLPRPPSVQTYWEVTVLLLVLCALVMVWATSRLAGPRVWDAAMVALSPLLIVQAFTNWDLFAVALATAGMLAWSRRRHRWAGVLLGLGAAAKLYPLFLLGPLFVLCLRAGKLREFATTLAWAVGAWLVVNLPVAIAYPTSWKTFFSLNSSRPADPDTLWNVAQYIKGGSSFPVGGLNVTTVLLFAAVCVFIAVLALKAPRRPRWPQLAFLVVAGFLITNKVWSPQYSLWLIPLAVLARPSWRMYLSWQAAEVLLWFPRMYWYLLTQEQGYQNQGLKLDLRGIGEEWFLAAVVIRTALVVLYCVLVVRDVLRPGRDVVRATGVDDPTGGVLDGAPDRSASVAPPRALTASGETRNTT